MAQDIVTVTWAEQGFQPIQFNGFRFGPFTLSTVVQEGETPTQAMDRAYRYLNDFAKKRYAEVLADYIARLADTGEAVRRAKKG